MPPPEHLYIRTLTQNDNSSLAAIARRVTRGSRVLDIGCGSGGLGKYLCSRLACDVDGITYSAEEARLAQENYRAVWVFNLESEADQLNEINNKYDFIICADILEHLRNPDEILSKCRALLAEEGNLLISIPNVAYGGVIASLLQGRFPYADEGLLDRTHVKFFTYNSATELIEQAGWDICHTESITLDMDQSEFGDIFLNLSPAIQRELLSQPDSGSYQFIFACKPKNSRKKPPTFIPARRPIVGFSAALYWTTNGSYTESQKLVSRGEIGLTRQQLCFSLPAHQPPLTNLRLDPADRPGFLRLHSCRLRASTGNTVWQWTPGQTSLCRVSREIFWGGGLLNENGLSLLVTGSDPQIELDIPSHLLATLPASSYLEVELSWPASLDFELIASRLSGLEFEHSQAKVAWQELQAQLESEIQALRQHQEKTIETIAESIAIQEKFEELHREVNSLSIDKINLERKIHALQNLFVVRMTRPLAKWWKKYAMN